MADLSHFDVNQVLGILQYLTILFFVAAGLPALIWRFRLRRAAIVVYLCALGVAVAYVVAWLARPPS